MSTHDEDDLQDAWSTSPEDSELQDDLQDAWSTTPEDSELQDDLNDAYSDVLEGQTAERKAKDDERTRAGLPIAQPRKIVDRIRSGSQDPQFAKKSKAQQSMDKRAPMSPAKLAAAKYLAGIVRMLEKSGEPELGYLTNRMKNRYKTVIIITQNGKVRILK